MKLQVAEVKMLAKFGGGSADLGLENVVGGAEPEGGMLLPRKGMSNST